MFSVSGIGPQVMYPVPYLVGAFHSLKTLADKGAILWPGRSNRSSKHTTQETQCDFSQINVSFNQLKEEFNLSHLPDTWSQDLLPQLFNRTQPDTRWSTSYASAQTFFENKHGFRASELHSHHTASRFFNSATLPHQLTHAHMCNISSTNYLQKRGFKTKRSVGVHKLTTTSIAQKQQGVMQAMADTFFKRIQRPTEKKGSIMPDMQSAFESHKTDRLEHTSFQTGFSEDQRMGQDRKTGSDTGAKAAYESHEEQQAEIDYNSFKAGYYDGYMMAGQKEATKGSTFGQKITRTLRIMLGLLALYLLFPSLLKPLLTFFQVKMGSDVDVVNSTDVTFDDVRGVDEAKAELEEIVNYLKDPEKYTKLGGKLPKGALLIGSPGTGKTLLARAVAGEAGVPFYFASGSDFDHVFVGTGAKKIRDMFNTPESETLMFYDIKIPDICLDELERSEAFTTLQVVCPDRFGQHNLRLKVDTGSGVEAKMTTPCVIFIDELDSIGGKRMESPYHPYARQTINQLLAEMDGFKQNEGIIVLGATNFPRSLDSALTRPGRFDISITVPTPDVKGRIDIFDLYLAKLTVAPDVDKEILARGTVGFTGADISNLVNQAALHAAKLNKEAVDMSDLEFAKDKILMGPERKSIIIDAKNKEITAFHEGGHALVAYFTKDSKPINKATIMPRGESLGHVSLLPEKDQWNQTKSQLLAQMDICMGGRVAEELVFGADQITTGASSDFDQATRIAQLMITKFGMSEKLGVMTYGEPDEYNTSAVRPSQETQSIIEKEVRKLLDDSYERATNLLKTHSKEHRKLAEALLKYETLSSEEIGLVMKGKKINSRP